MSRRTSSNPHSFGGEWTEQKLAIVRAYLGRCTVALKKQPFELWYIDAFAGTGTWTSDDDAVHPNAPDPGKCALFTEGQDPSERQFRIGSARIAIETRPSFDRFHFIEKSEAKCQELLRMRASLPDLADRIDVECADANDALLALCRDDWIGSGRRAVVFFDPYATQVRYATLEAIARTQAMDMWILFPLIAVDRMLVKSGQIPENWSQRLDDLLGTEKWKSELYESRTNPGLFGPTEEVIKHRWSAIGQLFVAGLSSSFAKVATNVKFLLDSTRSPLFMLCFAASNPKGAKIAVKIADHILKRADF